MKKLFVLLISVFGLFGCTVNSGAIKDADTSVISRLKKAVDEKDEAYLNNFEKNFIIYIYWIECPHCQKVNQYTKSIEAGDKYNIVKMEIQNKDVEAIAKYYYDKYSVQRAKPTDTPIPFLIYSAKTMTGDTPIIDGFKNGIFDPYLKKAGDDASKLLADITSTK